MFCALLGQDYRTIGPLVSIFINNLSPNQKRVTFQQLIKGILSFSIKTAAILVSRSRTAPLFKPITQDFCKSDSHVS